MFFNRPGVIIGFRELASHETNQLTLGITAPIIAMRTLFVVARKHASANHALQKQDKKIDEVPCGL